MKRVRMIAPVALSTLAACAWWMAGRPGLQDLDKLTFSHELHQENDVECDSCHEGVEAATDMAQSYLPAEEACMECHDKDDNCDMCHSDAGKRKPRPAWTSQLTFAHEAHLPRVEKGCLQCHPKAESATELPMGRPTMDDCMQCHNHEEDFDQGRCLACHPTLRRLPLKAIAQFDHGGDWISRHGMLARVQSTSCLQCHTQTTCAECHSRVPAAVNARLYPEQVERTLLHRGDWLSVHAMEARADGDTCLRCHKSVGFCESCHRASGLVPGAQRRRVPHPPGWAARGGSAFHGDEARIRIETCAACHDQGPASNCVQCHSSGGIGGNPHPSSFKDRHPKADIAGNPMCQTCHPTVTP